MRHLFSILLIIISPSVFGQNLFPVSIEGKYGFIDNSGQLIIPAIFEEEAEFVNNFALIKQQDSQIKVIDTTGKILKTFIAPNPNYYYQHYFSEGLLAAWDKSSESYGFIDEKGNWAIKPKYYDVLDFSNGLAAVWENADIHVDTGSGCGTPVTHEKWGYIDKFGNYKIISQFSSATPFMNGIAIVDNQFIDTNGNIIPDGQITDTIQLYRKAKFNHALVYGNPNIWVPFNDENFEACNIKFKYEGLDKYGFKDYNGNIVIQPIYDGAHFFSEELAGIEYPKGKWGYINCSGQIVVEPQYQFVDFFSEGLGAVQKNGKWGFIDKTGKLVIPFEYDESSKFKNGMAKVEKKGKTIYLNKKGEIIWKEK
jgi:hypothetical protein